MELHYLGEYSKAVEYSVLQRGRYEKSSRTWRGRGNTTASRPARAARLALAADSLGSEDKSPLPVHRSSAERLHIHCFFPARIRKRLFQQYWATTHSPMHNAAYFLDLEYWNLDLWSNFKVVSDFYKVINMCYDDEDLCMKCINEIGKF